MMSSLPKTMRGILIEKTGGTDVLQYRTDLPVPSPKNGQVLVKNSFIGVNFIDNYFRTGLYPSTKPEILGKEGAGKIVSIGSDVKGFGEGESVVWTATNGGYAEYSVTPVDKTVKIPSGLSEKDAAASLLQGLTALTLVEEAHKVKKGDCRSSASFIIVISPCFVTLQKITFSPSLANLRLSLLNLIIQGFWSRLLQAELEAGYARFSKQSEPIRSRQLAVQQRLQ